MAASSSSPTPAAKEFYKSKRVWLVLVISAIVLGVYFFMPSAGSDSDKESVKPAEQSARTIEIHLDPVEWSDWIRIETGEVWRLDPPKGGWVECKFWDGRLVVYADGEEPQWLGKIKNCIFQVRGDGGKAKLTIERKAPR